MAQITLRLSDDLLERIEESTGPEESRSAFLRRAARDRLGTDDLEELQQRVQLVEERVEALEEARRPWWHRIFKSRR